MPLDVYISADIEGICGFVHPEQDETEAAARQLATEVNAVIEGVCAIDEDATVTVADSHGRMRTLPLDRLDERATLVYGRNRPLGMVDGARSSHDFAVFVGYHDRPGSGGVLEHTFSGSLQAVRLDGTAVGETELNAALLADMGVPVGLVSGDDRLGETLETRLPAARFVPTKRTRGARAAEHRHPSTVIAELRETAAAVAADPPAPSMPLDLEPPVTVEVRFESATHAELAALWPEVTRLDDSRGVGYTAPSIPAMYRFIRGAASVRPA